MTSYEFCDVRRTGRILVVTIRRPHVLNALTPAATMELAAIFDDYEADPELWVAILTAEGDRAFCVGNDLKSPAEGDGRWQLPPSGFGGLTSRFAMVKPVIAAVNGVAAGGGFELALVCDIIVAAEHAEFTLPEVKLGLAAVAGGIHRLARSVGVHRAMAMVLTGRRVSAAEAYDLGLVAEVVPAEALQDAALRWAQEIVAASPMSVRATKQVLLQGLESGGVEAATLREYSALVELLDSDDVVEGPAAFLQKRQPVWRLTT
jgi:enoyl-CoA hydratase/carnithine racemase